MTKERLDELAEKLPRSAEMAPITEYNELYGAKEALELIRLARIALELKAQAPDYFSHCAGCVDKEHE